MLADLGVLSWFGAVGVGLEGSELRSRESRVECFCVIQAPRRCVCRPAGRGGSPSANITNEAKSTGKAKQESTSRRLQADKQQEQ